MGRTTLETRLRRRCALGHSRVHNRGGNARCRRPQGAGHRRLQVPGPDRLGDGVAHADPLRDHARDARQPLSGRPVRAERRPARRNGLVVGAYHFAKPGRAPWDPRVEADHFLDVVGLRAGDVVPVLDIEETGGLNCPAAPRRGHPRGSRRVERADGRAGDDLLGQPLLAWLDAQHGLVRAARPSAVGGALVRARARRPRRPVGGTGVHGLAMVGQRTGSPASGGPSIVTGCGEPRAGDGRVARRGSRRRRRDHGRPAGLRRAPRVLFAARQPGRCDHAAGDPREGRSLGPMDRRVRSGRRGTDLHRDDPRGRPRRRRLRPDRGRGAERSDRSVAAREFGRRVAVVRAGAHTRTTTDDDPVGDADDPLRLRPRHSTPGRPGSLRRRTRTRSRPETTATGRDSPGAATTTDMRSAAPIDGSVDVPRRSRSASVVDR